MEVLHLSVRTLHAREYYFIVHCNINKLELLFFYFYFEKLNTLFNQICET